MKLIKRALPKALILFALLTVICGIIYTGLITGFAQAFFPQTANGSIIRVDGKTYGSALLGQRFTDDGHMWGRVMKLDLTTFHDKDGRPLFYAKPSNLSPASPEYGKLVAQRVERLRESDPEASLQTVPVDLVTGSGSGLDPEISPAAAEYQVARIARARGCTVGEVQKAIQASTKGRFLGIFGEPTVNVLEVNLRLDGILK